MTLPISNYKERIVEAVATHSFTIICAETGAGKSTQVPQYLTSIAEQVIVTEPRVMAAKTLARRVAEEIGTDVGERVGYRTAYDSSCSERSEIVYCTDGLQLIRTIFNPDSEAENILIIDEVHEWNLNIETLIAWVKYMQGKWNTKVVIMSATLDVIKLMGFLGEDLATISVPGTLYDVEVEERPSEDLIYTIIENIECNKNVLVFVPGKREIHNVMDELSKTNAVVLPLHGEMDWDEQSKCLESYSCPKVVVATNVAQTSLTIPDIDVVVDTATARVSIAKDGIQGLFLEEISLADIIQRKGRAGRTKDGKYILCSDYPIKFRKKNSIPEIQRSILDRVVLQMSEIVIDAEEIKFFHQPDVSAIQNAKKELNAIGALDGNDVTKLGHKIVKMPVSVQLARMIVEAEKYGVTDQVITIAAIIEIGGLLERNANYIDFTAEDSSDLLAEYDVWKAINGMEYIDFRSMGIKKKNYFKIKEHINKLKETLYGVVDVTCHDDREAVLISCLYGLVSNIYVRVDDIFYGTDGTTVRLDNKSCIAYDYPKIVVGIPKTIEYKDVYGLNRSMNLLTCATKLDISMLNMIAEKQIFEEPTLRYSKRMDAVEITVKRYFAGILVDVETSYDLSHPELERLREEFEAELVSQKIGKENSIFQNVIVIDGKQFDVHHNIFDRRATVYLDMETLYTTEEKEVYLDSGERIYFAAPMSMGRMETNIVALRNAVEMRRIAQLRNKLKKSCEALKINSLKDIMNNASILGKVELTTDNGGFGDTPIYVYVALSLKKNNVVIRIVDDEALANADTLETLQHLFLREMMKKYPESSFSHENGKKKKLIQAELEVKADFDSLIREVACSLTIDNLSENLEFLEEYYFEIMSK